MTQALRSVKAEDIVLTQAMNRCISPGATPLALHCAVAFVRRLRAFGQELALTYGCVCWFCLHLDDE